MLNVNLVLKNTILKKNVELYQNCFLFFRSISISKCNTINVLINVL